jgi:ribose/xylose/arabinose/galactoside ABC-type transport system permease subunit
MAADSGNVAGRFFTAANWANILNNLAVPGIVALGVALVVIAGGIDLSFSSILACCAALAAWLQPHGFWLAVIGPLALGALLGAFNGLIVARVGANPLITTLGTQWLFLAVLFIVTGGGVVQGNTLGPFHWIANAAPCGVPLPIVILLLVASAAWFLATRTALGKHVYAHGSNRNGLRFAGVDADAVYFRTFVLMGLFVAVAGIVLSSRLVGVRPTEGNRYLLVVLTAVLLSGVNLSGGVGSLVHVLVATVVLGVIDNSMVLLAVQYKYQQIVKGCVFILAVLYNNYTAQRLASLRLVKK